MAQQNRASREAAAVETPVPVGAPAADAPVFDRFGMPMNPTALRSLTMQQLEAAMAKATANLRRKSPAEFLASNLSGVDGSPALDSIEAVWLLAKLKRAFGRSVVKLSDVPRSKWSTLNGVAELTHTAIAGLA